MAHVDHGLHTNFSQLHPSETTTTSLLCPTDLHEDAFGNFTEGDPPSIAERNHGKATRMEPFWDNDKQFKNSLPNLLPIPYASGGLRWLASHDRADKIQHRGLCRFLMQFWGCRGRWFKSSHPDSKYLKHQRSPPLMLFFLE